MKAYLDHLFVNPNVSIGMKIGDIEVGTRRRRFLALQWLLLANLVGNPKLTIGETASRVTSSAATAPLGSAKRAENGDLLLVPLKPAVETVGVIAARLHSFS